MNDLLKIIKCLGRSVWKSVRDIVDEVWLKPRCAALNYWMIN